MTIYTGKPPYLGRAVVCKNQNKSFKAYLAISRDFPIDFARLLDVLEVVAPFKHFNKLREFVQLKLPPGFPVQIEIPIFPTIVAKVTFQVRKRERERVRDVERVRDGEERVREKK